MFKQTKMKNIFLYTLIIALVFASCTANKQQASCCKKPAAKTTAAAAAALPEESLYNVTDVFTTQQGKEVALKNFAGKVTVMSMVFTHCAYACPTLTKDMQAIANKLKQNGIKDQDIQYVLVSFDTERDNPARLRAFSTEMELDNNWTLLRGDEEAVRQLSVLLNVQYEKAPDGSFSHSNVITVLDKEGRIATQLEGLDARNTEAVVTIQQLAAL
jgi:protein SCO1